MTSFVYFWILVLKTRFVRLLSWVSFDINIIIKLRVLSFYIACELSLSEWLDSTSIGSLYFISYLLKGLSNFWTTYSSDSSVNSSYSPMIDVLIRGYGLVLVCGMIEPYLSDYWGERVSSSNLKPRDDR